MSLPSVQLVQSIHTVVAALMPHIVSQTCQIAQVPAPTGAEHERARLVEMMLQEVETNQRHPIHVDAVGNVIMTIPGHNPHKRLMLAAHTDTVFSRDVPIVVRRECGRLYAPGIGDNSVAVAAMLALPAIFQRVNLRPDVDVMLTATVGEEGLGNLRGIRAIMDRTPDISACIAIEGHNLDRVTHVAVGSRRLQVTFAGPGGHSWGNAGGPSAIHAAGQVIAALSAIQLPHHPKSTVNVGMMSGGTSVNTIAPSAELVLDVRSTNELQLDRLVDDIRRIVRTSTGPGITARIDVIGERPAAVLSIDSPVARRAVEVLEMLRIRPIPDASSTDANIPLSRGIPAICLGLTTGSGVHTIDEYIDIDPLTDGITQLAITTLLIAQDVAHGRVYPAQSEGDERRSMRVAIASD